MVTMTQLTLLRHAKSIWKKKDNRDIDRTLNGQGRREAALMGLVCAERLPPPDLVLVSPAMRTRETVELFFESWMTAKPDIAVVEDLYLASPDDWIEILAEQTSGTDHILVCSHQPGLGEFASLLCPAFDGKVPPATIISIQLKNGGIERASGRLDFVGRPQDFQN